MQDLTHRHEYYNLMRDIPIYDRKDMGTRRLVATDWGSNFVDPYPRIGTGYSQINKYNLY